MKWQLSLLSLASLPAVLTAPVENPAHGAVEVKAREAASVESPEKRNDDEVELLWGSGRWQYGGSKREAVDKAPVERAVVAAAEADDDEVELLWGSGRWSYGGSKREEAKDAQVERAVLTAAEVTAADFTAATLTAATLTAAEVAPTAA
ncbi:hypothetical protein F5X98DRAFT_303977 [Xylaria grammica]|nr:hypothetical protein F5X98DRAFT_303977 [Xylaria grammica]